MGNNKEPQTVTIDDKQYELDSFSDQQRMFLEHVMDLDKKLNSCLFQADQLRVGKDAFLAMLKSSLEAPPPQEE